MTPTSRAPQLTELAWPMASSEAAKGGAASLGDVPEWDLSDLYKGIDDPAVARDLARAEADALSIKERFQGKLVALASDGKRLTEAIAAYEALSDLVGKLGSFAALSYAANQDDPARAKFYGDISEKLTRYSTNLIFVELELNR